MADQLITADDVIRAGACTDGVALAVHRLWRRLAAAMPAAAVARLLPLAQRRWARRAAALDGSGYGYGYGSGYGSGDGSGYGSGDGDGSGDGSGDGYGDGAAYGMPSTPDEDDDDA